jgi:effector-binding domain-containing protein
VSAVLSAQGIAITGPAFARFTPGADTFEIEAGFMVAAPVKPSGRVIATELPACEAAVSLHEGGYSDVGNAYAAIDAWIEANGRRAEGAPWESYLSPPDAQPPRTEVFFPLA